MDQVTSVDAPPASNWSEPRPEKLAQQLWATARPTDATIAELSLPDGSVVHGSDGQLLGWESAPGGDGLDQLWLTCARQFPDTGLWPICDAWPLKPTRRWNFIADDGRPYWYDPYAVPSDVYDAASIADRRDYLQEPNEPDFFRELLADYGLQDTSMTLAHGSALPTDALATLTAPTPPERLTLVACRRPADAVLLLDFGVPNDSATPGIFAGVLRSWEARFGVLPVMLETAWTSFQVLAPPTDQPEIERLAVEIFAFATDTGVQGGFHHDGYRKASPQELAQSREWLIWWD